MNFLKKEAIILTVLVAPFIYLLLVWNQIPEQLPVHWNAKGEVDNRGPKYLIPLLNVGIYLVLLLVPKIDPRKANYQLFSATYYKLRLILVLFFSTLMTLIITKALGYSIDLNRLVFIAVILLLTAIGNYMTTVKPNWFIGIRVPWTLESDYVWRKTHYFGGMLWFWLGLALLVPSFFLPQNVLSACLLGAVMVMVIAPVTYAYIIYRQAKHEKDKH